MISLGQQFGSPPEEDSMKFCNVGWYDRSLRVALGLVLTSFAFWGVQDQIMLVFIAMIVSGVVGYCPLYSALNANTI